jgi:dUTP pyrophosphatase
MTDDDPFVKIEMFLEDEALRPIYAHFGDAGADLCSAIDVIIPPGERMLVGTGVHVAIPRGYVGLVHPRSGLALKHGITVLNAPGTIDAGYLGEIGVILYNTSDKYFAVGVGDRIAQLVIQKVEVGYFALVSEKDFSKNTTHRGADGFGSTGVG